MLLYQHTYTRRHGVGVGVYFLIHDAVGVGAGVYLVILVESESERKSTISNTRSRSRSLFYVSGSAALINSQQAATSCRKLTELKRDRCQLRSLNFDFSQGNLIKSYQMVIKIQILFDQTRFRKDFSVSNQNSDTSSRHIGRKIRGKNQVISYLSHDADFLSCDRDSGHHPKIHRPPAKLHYLSHGQSEIYQTTVSCYSAQSGPKCTIYPSVKVAFGPLRMVSTF